MTPLPELGPHLRLWVEDGLIDRDSAERIRRAEAELAPAPLPPNRRPVVLEALGYVGGVLVVIGAVLAAARLWDRWTLAVRLLVVAACAVVLLLAAAVVPASRVPAARRLRALLLALSTAATALLASLLAVEVLDLDGLDVGVLVSGVAAASGLLLWRASRHPLQQVVAFVALMVLTGTAVADLAPSSGTGDVLPGAGMLALGAAWLGLALSRHLPSYPLGGLLGSAGVVAGSAVLVSSDWGRFVAVTAVVALLVLGVLLDELLVVGVGTAGLLVVLPPVLTTWFPGAVAAPVVLLVTGTCVVLLALRFLRRAG